MEMFYFEASKGKVAHNIFLAIMSKNGGRERERERERGGKRARD
jgi:hypothetical protein